MDISGKSSDIAPELHINEFYKIKSLGSLSFLSDDQWELYISSIRSDLFDASKSNVERDNRTSDYTSISAKPCFLLASSF